MNYDQDDRIVMTLDAGGTNFVFSAIQANKEIVNTIKLPSHGNNLNKCLDTIVDGFHQVEASLTASPVAISFAFPGPADYPRGIIGDLANLPAFRGGVALGPMLESKFDLPVFMNNDGDLFAYGEAIAGYLPHINSLLEQSSSSKQYKNLAGFTLGTGLGGGIVHDYELFLGDNSAGVEVCNLRNRTNPETSAEDGASIRAVKRVYAEVAGIDFEEAPSPYEIYKIGVGEARGNRGAAVESYRQLGRNLGDAIANVLTLVDGIAVIGGGVAGAHHLFWDAMTEEMRTRFKNPLGGTSPRFNVEFFDLEDEKDLKRFIKGKSKVINVPGTSKKIEYDPLLRIGVGLSKNETSKIIALGAYAFALHALDSK